MLMKNEDTASIRVTHRFTASAARVFDAWLDPVMASKFLFATPTGQLRQADIDGRVDGVFTIVDRRDGEDVAHTGKFVEVERPRRLTFTLAVPKYSPAEETVSIEIEAVGDGCELALTHQLANTSVETKARAIEGWTGILEVLFELLPETTPTCGMGLAQHATVPARIGLMFRALADTLELHRTTLRLQDARARTEDDAYQQLASSYRQLATLVQGAAAQMSNYRELPAAAHDQKAFGQQHFDVFEKYVKVQSRLLALLKAAAERDEKMLATMKAAGKT